MSSILRSCDLDLERDRERRRLRLSESFESFEDKDLDLDRCLDRDRDLPLSLELIPWLHWSYCVKQWSSAQPLSSNVGGVGMVTLKWWTWSHGIYS